MEESEYKAVFNLEDSHWRYIWLRQLICSYIARFGNANSDFAILDAGCGTGGFCKFTLGHTPCSMFGIDISETGINFCKKRGLNKLSIASVDDAPFSNGSFDFIVSTDVIYHKRVEEISRALKEFHRTLKDGGHLILTVPAYNFIKGPHDITVHTKRRFRKKEIATVLENAGFKIKKLSYIFFFIFPLVLTIRFYQRLFTSSKKVASDLKPPSKLENALMTSLLKLEQILLYRTNFPFGVSIFCVAGK